MQDLNEVKFFKSSLSKWSDHGVEKIVATIILAGAASAASLAHADAKLAPSEPTPDSALPVAPKVIRLHSNEALEPAFSNIALLDARQLALALPKVAFDPNDPKTLSVSVPPLASGSYSVRWTAMTHDGHKVKGRYSFSVK